MKNAHLLCVTALCVAVLAVRAAGNLVSDPGFEDAGDAAWNPYSSYGEFQEDFDYSAFSTNLYDGSEALSIMWTNPVPQWNVFVAEQQFAVSEGYTWDASVYAKAAAPLNGAEMYLETIFYDGSSTEVGKMKSVSLTDYTEWTELQNSGLVSNSAVTASLRLVVFTSGGDSSEGSAFFDAADATATIPEPATLGLIALAAGIGFLTRRRQHRS